MPIQVELYGIPRLRAGVQTLELEAGDLGALLAALGQQLPQLREVCLDADGRLNPGYLANINGRTFVSDTTTPLSDGDCVLILSADAGG